jgi:hypothetical protein
VAHLFGGFCSTTGKTRQKNPLINWEVGEGGRWLGLAHFHNGYSFLTISPNLHDIRPFFLLIPSRYLTAHLVTLFRLLVDGYSLFGSKK